MKQVQIACAHIVVRKNFENLSISVENLDKKTSQIFSCRSPGVVDRLNGLPGLRDDDDMAIGDLALTTTF